MTNVLLLNACRTPDLNQGFTGRIYPPTDLCSVAAYLRENGFGVEILDANALRISNEALPGILSKKRYDFGVVPTDHSVGICMDVDISHKIEAANLLANRMKTIVIGPHVKLLPDHYGHRFKEGVLMARGEPEEIVLEVVQGREPRQIQGLSYMENGEMVHTPNREPIGNLDKLPIPAYELLPIDRYEWYYMDASLRNVAGVLLRKVFSARNTRKFITLRTSRGCPFTCSFCYVSYGRKVRTFSLERVRQEVDYLKSLGVEEIRFEDETFTLSRKRTEELCKIMKQAGVAWACQTRADLVDRSLLETMKNSGCFHVAFGVESPEQKVSEAVRKGWDVEELARNIQAANDIRLATSINMLLGLPEESWQSLEVRKQFVQYTRPKIVGANIVIPYPGTELFEMGKRSGQITGDTFEDGAKASGLIGNRFATREELERYFRQWQEFVDCYNILRWSEDSKLLHPLLRSLHSLLGPERFLLLLRGFLPRNSVAALSSA